MLDQLTLSDKLKVAHVWFGRAFGDDMPFTDHTAKRFGELLQQCQHEAAIAAARLDIAEANLALMEGRHALALLKHTPEDASNNAIQRAATLAGGAG